MKKKMFGLFLLLISLFIFGCDENDEFTTTENYKNSTTSQIITNSNQNTTTNNNNQNAAIIDGKFFVFKGIENTATYNSNYYMDLNNMTYREYIDYISSFKNKNVEINISNNGYTEEELYDILSKTAIRFRTNYNLDGKSYHGEFMGNIYDIDNQYVYIITCAHGMFDKNILHDNLELYAMFITNEEIEINIKNIYATSNSETSDKINDFALITIPISNISQSTLNNVKSLNIDNFCDIPLNSIDNYNFYHISSCVTDATITKENGLSLYSDGNLIIDENNYCDIPNNLIFIGKSVWNFCPGNSGSAIFDQYGNYHFFIRMTKQNSNESFVSTLFLPKIIDLLKESNSNYFLQK